jgi:hypothetical protein
MHLTKELLVAARRWENRWLSRILVISWRVDEGVAGYRTRVSAIVSDMFRKAAALRAHERIAAVVFKEACNDTKSASLIRSDRNEAWRAVIRHESAKRRREADCTQSRTGKRVAFEAPFVSLAGPVWGPELADAENTSFKSRRNKFIKRLCELWSIPSTLCGAAPSGFVAGATPDDADLRFSPMSSIIDLILPDVFEKDKFWASDFSQLEFVTDNQTLANIAVGAALVQSNKHEEVLRSAVASLESLFSNSFAPRYWSLAPVVWRPREQNKLADALCNCAMNHKCNAEWICSSRQHDYVNDLCFLQVHSDGGVRHEDACSATAFTVISFVPEGNDYKRNLLYAACKYYPYNMSPFHAEALAFRDALEFVRNSYK